MIIRFRAEPAYAVFALVLLAGVFVSTSPQGNIIGSATVAGLIAVMAALAFATGRINMSGPALPLAAFAFLLVLSYPVALYNGTSLQHWFMRGVFPFMFLAVFFLLPVTTPASARALTRVVVYGCFAWAAFVALTLALNAGLAGSVRWTVITKDLLFPYNLVAIPLLVLSSHFTRAERLVGIPLMLILTAGGGYRMQFLLLAIFFAAVGWRYLRRGLVIPLLVAGAALLAGLVWYASTDTGAAMLARFGGAQGDSSRFAEIQFAFARFLESPLFGKGLGFPIPTWVTYSGREDYLERIALREGGYWFVQYMHNIVMYLLMTMGALGLATFGWFIARAFGGRAPAIVEGQDRKALIWALGLLLAFNLSAATFTLMQYHLLLAPLVALLAARRPLRQRGHRAQGWQGRPSGRRG